MAQLTIPLSASADDAYVSLSSASYPPTGTAAYTSTGTWNYAVRDLSGSSYRIWNILLRFDTSPLPDTCTILSAYVLLYSPDRQTADGLSVLMDYYSWVGSSADYTAAAPATAHAGTSIGAINYLADTSFALLNPDTNISKTANTSLRVTLSQRSGDAAPTGVNVFGVAAYDNTNSYPVPRLVVNYSLPTITPAVLSQTSGYSGSVSDVRAQGDGNWLVGG